MSRYIKRLRQEADDLTELRFKTTDAKLRAYCVQRRSEIEQHIKDYSKDYEAIFGVSPE